MRCKALKPTSDSRLQDFLGTLQSFEAYTPKIPGQGYFIFPEILGVHVNSPKLLLMPRISDAAGAGNRAIRTRQRERHLGTSDRSLAIGATRPAIHRREPAGRGQQYRHRDGRPCASRRLSIRALVRAGRCWMTMARRD